MSDTYELSEAEQEEFSDLADDVTGIVVQAVTDHLIATGQQDIAAAMSAMLGIIWAACDLANAVASGPERDKQLEVVEGLFIKSVKGAFDEMRAVAKH